MKFKEKLMYEKIARLIENESFESAIKEIDLLENHTTAIRKNCNIKAQCLIGLGKYECALALYNDYFPYIMIDEDDLIALRNLAEIYKCIPDSILAEKYNNSYKIFQSKINNKTLQIDLENNKSKFGIYTEFYESENIPVQVLEKIINDNLTMTRITEAAVFLALAKFLKYKISEETKNVFLRYKEAMDFTSELAEAKNNIFCVISIQDDEFINMKDLCLVRALSILGNSVYHLKTICTENSFELSLNQHFNLNICEKDQKTIKIPCLNKKLKVQSTREIINWIFNRNTNHRPIVVFGDSDFMMEINEEIEISKRLEMYFRHFETQPIPHMDCLLLGPFWDIKSFLWKQDIETQFNATCKFDFSIIIPVRNSLKYLKSTIETCINQNYMGTYEILISDNSTAYSNELINLINSFNCQNIRYIKTPFDLSLSKSFEFAYLNTQGKYLISIGADDGLLVDSLSIISDVIKQRPDRNVIAWELSYYFWPGYPHGKLSNAIVYNKNSSKELSYSISISNDLIKEYAMGERDYLKMPNLYLVTCVKKEHINKVIETSGKFEDGDSQDVYTGMLNLFLEDSIEFINKPIVIAGNSEVSVGFNSESNITSMSNFGEKFKIYKSAYRYMNYYSKEVRDFSPPLDLGAGLLTFKEFLKVKRYGLKDIKTSEEDILTVIHNIHKWLPEKYHDKSLYLSHIEKIAHSFGEDFYKVYISKRTIWDMKIQLFRYMAKSIKNKYIRKAMKLVYRLLQFLLREIRSSEDKKNINKEFRDIKIIKLKDNNLSGIIDASKLLSDYINSNR